MAKCTLEVKYNKCPYFKDENECSSEETACGMREKERREGTSSDGYVREPRWYELLQGKK